MSKCVYDIFIHFIPHRGIICLSLTYLVYEVSLMFVVEKKRRKNSKFQQ